jgi:hypothetical protein
MRFMMFMIPRVYQPETPAAERPGEGFAPPAEAVVAMMKYNEELAKAGALVSLDGLHPVAKGARVAYTSGKPTVTDGPFIESREVVGGYWMIDVPARRSARVFLESAQSFRHAGVKSKEEAVGWAKRVPAAAGDVVEVRQVFEMSEFPADVQKAAENPTVQRQLEKQRKS